MGSPKSHTSWEETTVDFPTLKDLQRSIPKHCFEPSLGRSLSYVARDLLIAGGVFTAAALWIPQVSQPWQGMLWAFYAFAQGTMFWAMFVLAHDCGHGSFSKSKLANSIVGNLLNSLILVPYLPWALSHRHHHQNTGHIDRDEPFAPERSSRKPWKVKKDAPRHVIRRFLIGGFGTMWFPYLAFFSKALCSHFWPWDPLFRGRVGEVVLSVLSFALVLGCVIAACFQWGFVRVLLLYLIPVFVFASWLVVTTFLHHNDQDVPWYGDKEWTYVKGNLSTVDRSYGIFNNLVHNIGTHQVHHVFPFIPHYHLLEATQGFQRAYPHLVRVKDESVFKAYFKNVKNYALYGHTTYGVERFVYRDVLEDTPQQVRTSEHAVR